MRAFSALACIQSTYSSNSQSVAISFEINPHDPLQIGFGYSPVFEAVASFYVLLDPKHHPLQLPWVRRCRSLSPGLKKEIQTWGFAFKGCTPGFLDPGAHGPDTDFDEEIAAARRTDPETVLTEMTLGLLLPADALDRGNNMRDSHILDQVLASAREQNCEAAVKLLIEDPLQALERTLSMLQSYWDEAFAKEWNRVEPEIAAEVERSGRELATGGIERWSRALAPNLRWDQPSSSLVFDCSPRHRDHEHAVDVEKRGGLTLVPSVYTWPHVRVGCCGPWPATVIYPTAGVRALTMPELPDGELLSTLKALAEDSRLRIARMLSRAPLSTQEIAQRLSLSDAAVSRHLRTLADAGIVESRRDGYYVLYSLKGERVGAVGPSLAGFLNG
jgi:DNA-binding transcriptional ArsR family regulator